MPWEEVTVMAQRAEFIEQALREEVNLRALCRKVGIRPRTGYKWLKRFRELGEMGLYDRSRRTRHSPRTQSEQGLLAAFRCAVGNGSVCTPFGLRARRGEPALPSSPDRKASRHRRNHPREDDPGGWGNPLMMQSVATFSAAAESISPRILRCFRSETLSPVWLWAANNPL